jgi:hypothetical protein
MSAPRRAERLADVTSDPLPKPSSSVEMRQAGRTPNRRLEDMSDHGRFVWYELMTPDTAAAKAFYGKVVGWTAQDVPMPGMTYTLLKTGETQVGGLMGLPEELRAMGVPPNWSGYVAVDDVDAAAEKVKTLGGTVRREPGDIPGVGRFAVVADPQGAVFALFKWLNPGSPAPMEPRLPGRVGWHELTSSDWEKGFDFYSALFGWKKDEPYDMGAMGTYQIFSDADGGAIGGMMNRPPNVQASYWKYYFNVGDIDAAAERVTSSGGEILHGPAQVPGGAWIIQGLDPQKAMFALLGMRG